VLFHLPPGFSPEKPFAFLVFFHGNNSDIQQTDRDYQIAEQVDGSGRNVILILPQLAKNATDSSPGKFFNHNAFKSFMVEASEILARRLGEEHLPALRAAPVFLAAFSGGYKSTAYVLDRGGEDRRIRVVFLIDALYEDLDKFGKWITDGAESRLIAAIYTQGTENNTRELADRISTQRIKINWTWPASLAPGSVSLIQSSNEHLMTPLLGPPERPLSHFLSTLDRRLFDAP